MDKVGLYWSKAAKPLVLGLASCPRGSRLRSAMGSALKDHRLGRLRPPDLRFLALHHAREGRDFDPPWVQL